MVHEQMRQQRLQVAVLVLTHVPLLDPSIHVVAVRAVARGEVFPHRNKVRPVVVVNGQSRHAVIIAPNRQPRQPNPPETLTLSAFSPPIRAPALRYY